MTKVTHRKVLHRMRSGEPAVVKGSFSTDEMCMCNIWNKRNIIMTMWANWLPPWGIWQHDILILSKIPSCFLTLQEGYREGRTEIPSKSSLLSWQTWDPLIHFWPLAYLCGRIFFAKTDLLFALMGWLRVKQLENDGVQYFQPLNPAQVGPISQLTCTYLYQ